LSGDPEIIKNMRLYIAVWGVLVITAILEVLAVEIGLVRLLSIFLVSVALVQTTLIALVYQHLKDEPASIKTLPVTSFIMLIVLISAAITSVLACTPYLGG